MIHIILIIVISIFIGFILGVLIMMDTAIRTVRRKQQEAARLQELDIQEVSRRSMEEMSKKLEGKTPEQLKAMGIEFNITETKVK